MTMRGERQDAQGFEEARSGTIYWTLSLYIEADRVAETLGLKDEGRVPPSVFRRLQRTHLPSVALANAVDPLMNDIADREIHGEVQEFLLAALDGEDARTMAQAEVDVRRHKDLIFTPPGSVSWTTEGVHFHAHPEGLGDDRAVRLRRFWMAHNNGGLSYHLSFSHYYGGDYQDGQGRTRSGYDPSTFYFLSLLQKLAAPKEYNLAPDRTAGPDAYVDVFDEAPLGIDPLDKIMVRTDGLESQRFWPFVRSMFDQDAGRLFPRLAEAADRHPPSGQGDYAARLLDLVPFIEVPGLKVPKSRFMFMLHDERFFDRLMPLDPKDKSLAPRKRMVQQGCYEPYQQKIRNLMRPSDGQPPRAVHLGRPEHGTVSGESAQADYWTWVRDRADYQDALADGAFVRANPNFDPNKTESDDNPHWLPISDRERIQDRIQDLTAAMRAGDCVQIRDFRQKGEARGRLLDTPLDHNIPAFESGRADCLDYLFLAGFNQNIIDFMNQDTSEILDSIDPIYPDSSEQSDERFFVRYANHRAMISYAPRSRSLETGNDYIGACPYAFLIHVLALHNEFLARGHEQKTMARIARIEALVDGKSETDPRINALKSSEPLEGQGSLSQAEFAINQAKLAEYSQYERFRHANPFRYDTERDVFDKLEELRGVSRKKEALSLAISSLEDHAADLSRRQQRKNDDEAAKRGQSLNILLGMTGIFGAGQMFYWIGEKTSGKEGGGADMPTALTTPVWQFGPSKTLGAGIMAATEVTMILALAGFIAFLLVVILGRVFRRKPNEATPPN